MKLMLYMVLAALCGLSIVVTLQFRVINNTRADARRATCQAWTGFDRLLASQIRANEKTAAQLAYYRDHPAELAKVRALDARFIGKLVPPAYC